MRHLRRLPTLAVVVSLLAGTAALAAPAALAAARPLPAPATQYCATVAGHQLDGRAHSMLLGKACSALSRA
ncbi:Spy/CpxP family protein refolding chaperone [Kitasatospora sp. MAA4]|uniref:hypothetical protein n=1 Tax=Kitasatospora sp. MAA4 TaxID=3035093 RepID=UPI002475E19D|nr:hypothetical protein [Kitasatospora sp. MAA4]MDH6131966.1 Spy/CpxP family protein refolding chaperone [Kitasatospora sp. MAA4]